MAVAVALWSLTIAPGEPTVITPPADLRITNVALGDKIEDEKSRTTVKLIYRQPGAGEDSEDDEEGEDEDEDEGSSKLATAVLCSLTFGKIEQTTVDVVLSEDEEYLVEVVGKNTIHLTGNYIDQRPPDQDPDVDSESEDAYDLRDVSSDVEIDPEELDILDGDEGRFEEIAEDEEEEEEAPKEKLKKRPRDSDAMNTPEQGEKLAKSQKKKQKKLKAADGTAVEAPSDNAAEAPAQDKAEAKKDKKKDKEGKKAAGEVKTLAGGLQVVDHKAGKGPAAKRGDMVSMRYIGKLQNGKVFDQNTKGKPFNFRLGKGEVIKGWDVGIEGMHVGGERLLTIPAPMAYGKQKQAGIPPNSTLVFEVKLLGIN